MADYEIEIRGSTLQVKSPELENLNLVIDRYGIHQVTKFALIAGSGRVWFKNIIEEGGEKVLIKSIYEAKGDVKSLNWDETNRRWDRNRKCWLINANSIKHTINHLIDRGYEIALSPLVSKYIANKLEGSDASSQKGQKKSAGNNHSSNSPEVKKSTTGQQETPGPTETSSVKSPCKSSKFEEVPRFSTYFPSISDMNSSQKAFYKHWLKGWKQGELIAIEGNVSYIFVYAYQVLTWHRNKRYQELISELRKLREIYSQEEKLYYLDIWIADTYVILNQLEKAFSYKRQKLIFTPKPTNDEYWTLKRHLNLPVTGVDVHIPRAQPITDYGKAHIDRLNEELTKMIRKYEKDNQISLIKELTKRLEGRKWNAYTGSSESYYVDLNMYEYDLEKAQELLDSDMYRKAENSIRKKEGVPEIGEGWVSETTLKNMVSKLIEPLGYSVQHHAYPAWLKGQHLDIYVPDLKLGIEYMGKQHYQPVEVFGGEDGFKEIKKRDREKSKICREKGIHLIQFKYDEPIDSQYVANRLSKDTSLDFGEGDIPKEIKVNKNPPSYVSAKEEFSDAREKLAEKEEKQGTKCECLTSDDKKLKECQASIEMIEKHASKIANGNWESTPYFLKKKEWKKNFEEFGYYIEANPHLVKQAKAWNIVTLHKRVSVFERGLLFEPFSFPLLAKQIEDRNLEVLVPFAWWPRASESKEKMRELLSNVDFCNRHYIFKRAQGLSRDAKIILWRLTYKKKKIHLLQNFQSYDKAIVNPESAAHQLYDRGLALINDDIPELELLKVLTLKEIKTYFYHQGMSWSGKKMDKIKAIVEEYPEDVIRDRVYSQFDDTILERTWEFDPITADLVDAQMWIVKQLVATERARINYSAKKAEKDLERRLIKNTAG